MPAPVRLRQIALITSDLTAVVDQIRSALGLDRPYRDPAVAEFGLENRVFAAGDCFVEVLAPVAEHSAGARYLERRGGDAGYMAIFQVADRELPRRRAADLGIRVAWLADLAGMSGTHLHPADVPGAIVSLDWANPPESWRWAGPAWTGGAPGRAEDRAGGITGLTLAVVDPVGVAQRWAEVLGLPWDRGVTVLRLDDAGQDVRFVPAPDPSSEGIVACGLALPNPRPPGPQPVLISGVRFAVAPT